MDFSAIVYNGHVTWVHLVSCPWSSSKCQLVFKMKMKHC